MRFPSFYNIKPNALFSLIYQNKQVQWVFSFNPIVIYIHEPDTDVYFQTLYSDNLANRLLSLTQKLNNLKFIQNGD